MRVLVIPEHFSQDQYILKPVVQAMLAAVGKLRANIQVCQDPLLGSVEQAMRWERIAEIIDIYPQVDLFLLIVDRDDKPGRRTQLVNLEDSAAAILPRTRSFMAEHAWQEVEVWALAGCTDLPWQWQSVRAERDSKERYFTPYVRQRGIEYELGGGRRTLGREAAGRYTRIRQLCSEITALEMRILEWIQRERL